MKRYNLINNSLGWLCFLVAAVTYLLTIEPTASFWDCPEFITQGFKLEVGHPPGNPIFMLTARFFVTLFGGGAETAAVAVNTMSALLSAGTILLLFWTITHLAKRLLVRDGGEISAMKMVLIMGAGLCGSLAYTWSDTFWFSAVEGEVYAFSSFCTALVFWLILKWENRADNPHSDRYLVLIAYIIGVSIAVHLLNLLCIPAIVLVFYFRKFKHTNVVGSLIALAVSVVLIVLILYGLVPGFIAVAQRFESFVVNTFGASYNTGVLIYALIALAVFIWTIYQLRIQKSATKIKVGVVLSVILSGMPFIGHSGIVPTILILALIGYLWFYCKQVPVRVFNVVIMSIFVIFVGYSSYALLLIRSSANTPMNQNAPDNVFDLASYLNREQYGDTPLLNGPMITESYYQFPYAYLDEEGNQVSTTIIPVDIEGQPMMGTVLPIEFDGDNVIDLNAGKKKYVKVSKTSADQPDEYVEIDETPDYKIPGGMSMLFSRMYSDRSDHVRNYKSWSMYEDPIIVRAPEEVRAQWVNRGPVYGLGEAGYATLDEIRRYMDFSDAHPLEGRVRVGDYSMADSPMAWSPSFGYNLAYFLGYQLNHMYWRYFMWNFAGRQNDMPGNGEPHLGNWLSGIPALDNARLGDQSELPAEFGEGNPGHNVFYMLPLLLGLIGLLWQSMMKHAGGEKRGVEQFWIVFFLFFMTGIAIVLYLNQPPGQPRERDYAFAGSFYAFAIWIGLGVPGLAMMLKALFGLFGKKKDKEKSSDMPKGTEWALVGVATAFGLFVPLQMVSQTWDDHDRSNRYAARDFGMNYLNSLAPNAIIFVNGDNDTFPLWYAQEVEGVRTDVKVINLSYLSQDWYARQVAMDTYDADGTRYMMPEEALAYNRFSFTVAPNDYLTMNGPVKPVKVDEALTAAYKAGRLNNVPDPNNPEHPFRFGDRYVIPTVGTGTVYAPLDTASMMTTFGQVPADSWSPELGLYWDLTPSKYLQGGGLTQMLTYDIIGTSASNGFKRPVYFATTVGPENVAGFRNNVYATGMAQMVTPFNNQADPSPVAAFGYCNIIGRFKFGGLDSGKKLYLDDTVRRMVTSTRLGIMSVIEDLLNDSKHPATAEAIKVSAEKGLPKPKNYLDMAINLLDYMDKHMPASVCPYDGIEPQIVSLWSQAAALSGNVKYLDKAAELNDKYLEASARLLKYANTLRNTSPAMYQNLMRAERSNLRRGLMALSEAAYIKLLRYQLGLPADSDKRLSGESLVRLGAPFESYENYEALKLVFISDLTMDDIEEAAQSDDMTNYMFDVLQKTAVIVNTLEDAGIKQSADTEKYLKNAGVDRASWTKVLAI